MARFKSECRPVGCAFIETFAEIHAKRLRPSSPDVAEAAERQRLLANPHTAFGEYISHLLASGRRRKVAALVAAEV